MNKRLYMLASAVIVLTLGVLSGLMYVDGNSKAMKIASPTRSTSPADYTIQLDGSNIQSDSKQVSITDKSVLITAGGRYEIKGEGEGIVVKVDSSLTDDVTILLNQASFSSLELESTGTNVVTLVDKTENKLSSAEAGIKASNVTINGQGSLTMENMKQYGVFATDDLVIESGRLNIQSSGSGLVTLHKSNPQNANMTINGGHITVASNIEKGHAGLIAGNRLIINDGEIDVLSSYEGYVGKYITINGGKANLVAADDGIVSKDPFYEEGVVSDVDVTVNGGVTQILAAGDALDSNGALTVAGGNNLLASSSQTNGSMDFEGKGVLSGGTLWALGSADAVQTFSETKQALISVNLTGEKGDVITINDATGKTVASETANVNFSNITFSSAELVSDQTYTISLANGASGQAVASTN